VTEFDTGWLDQPVMMHANGHGWPRDTAKTYEIHAPGRGTVLASVQDAGPEEVSAVVDGAQGVAAGWAALAATERARRVVAFAEAMERSVEELAYLDALNGGHPIRWTRFGALKGAETMRYFAGIALEAVGRTIPATADHLHLSVREPVGVEKRWIGVSFGGYNDSRTSTEISSEELLANTQIKEISIRLR
jgi:acyl-CoA reductase-like NAD-dependent aldehyde dehydrogenase